MPSSTQSSDALTIYVFPPALLGLAMGLVAILLSIGSLVVSLQVARPSDCAVVGTLFYNVGVDIEITTLHADNQYSHYFFMGDLLDGTALAAMPTGYRFGGETKTILSDPSVLHEDVYVMNPDGRDVLHLNALYIDQTTDGYTMGESMTFFAYGTNEFHAAKTAVFEYDNDQAHKPRRITVTSCSAGADARRLTAAL